MDETSDPNFAISETSSPNVTVSEASDQNVIASEHPDLNATVSELSNLKITTSDLSAENPSMSVSSPARSIQPSSSDDVGTSQRANTSSDVSYDFALILRPARILHIAIVTFTYPSLNSEKEALVKVGPDGFELSIWHVDKTGNELFVMLQLRRDGLEGFQCTKPMRKMIPLKGLSRVFRAAHAFNPESVAIFVEQGSNRISFQWGTSALDFALGRPINIDLEEAELTYEELPTVLYIHETIVPSKDLITVLSMHSRYLGNGSHLVELNIRPETVEGEEMQTEEVYKVRMELSFGSSLQMASNLAENCSMYLIRDPQPYIMIAFKLGYLGEMVFLNEAEFVSCPHLPVKGQYGSLMT